MNTIDRILDLMNKNKITAKKLTKEANLPASSITEWKNGKYEPSANAIAKIADYFGVSTDYLLGKDSQKQRTAPNGLPLTPEQIKLLDVTNDFPVEDLQKLLEYAELLKLKQNP